MFKLVGRHHHSKGARILRPKGARNHVDVDKKEVCYDLRPTRSMQEVGKLVYDCCDTDGLDGATKHLLTQGRSGTVIGVIVYDCFRSKDGARI